MKKGARLPQAWFSAPSQKTVSRSKPFQAENFFGSSRGNEAHLFSGTGIGLEPPHVGGYFFDGLPGCGTRFLTSEFGF
jgi:hypothetical protein